ncbi:erythromycin esterase family protein [Pseudomonas sp. MAP12]|uniref:Erythromycin esterase family protein n=1 Tax=Geopseudomonas aromaticivorans TaxID=2849492 RepID=A0ABS6N0R9_9GAMM|nr:erythromycin esterase family protein [Pseudomonas aromaticivorans]MBV2134645.1 erythromycin esterase family protein [Pseudomonas aromaticivorans]
MKDHSAPPSDQQRLALLRRWAKPLPAPDSAEFAALFDRYADARVVLIGEASHGTAEFYQTRAAITRHLIARHGFTIVAVEADWPDAAQIDRQVRQQQPPSWQQQAFQRFPSWMWRNREVAGFCAWLSDYNASLPAERRVEFRGLDVYSLGASISAVLDYLERTDAQAAQAARQRYGCLLPWQDAPALYGRNVLHGQQSCEDAVVEQLRTLLEQRLERLGRDGEAFFDATRNAHVVQAAEQYYRIMYHGSTPSWNLRDQHMFDTLHSLLEHRGPQARAVVWAHNSHIGNASATEMGWAGQFNIGELCRNAWGREAVLIGMGTDRGEVAAADNWDEPMRIKQVRPSRHDSWEQVFLQTGLPASLTDWRDDDREDLRAALREPLLERAIGVIYRPESERQSHYFEAVLAEQFDAWIWLAETHAVTPLDSSQPCAGEEDTYPFGE